MINSSNRDHHSQPVTRKRLWLMILSRGGIFLGGVLLLGVVGVTWRLWTFIQKELTPLAAGNLTSTLNRPVKLGEVTQFSLTGIRFAASSIPATATDPDRVTMEAVEVGFDPLRLILNRRLKLDVTLVNPDIYIEQDDQGRWVTTTIAPPGKDGPIKTDLDHLRFRNAKVALLPFSAKTSQPLPTPNPPITFSQFKGVAQLLENNHLIKFDVAGQGDSGGNISIQGDTRIQANSWNLQLKAQNLPASHITRLIKLPVNLQAGRVNGDLQIKLVNQQPALLFGSATAQGVTLQIPRVPQLLSNTQGNLNFQGLVIQLENIATNYGKIPVLAKGIIDSQTGFKLAGRINRVTVPTALETLKVKLPWTATGEVKADLQITGSLTQPILSGTVASIKPARIDKVDLKTVSSKFELSTSNSLITLKDIQGIGTLGGEVTAAGTIKLSQTPRLDFNFTAKNVPGDAIAKVYDATPTFKIGTVSATGQLTGVPSQVQTVVQWQAPGATYPASGEMAIAPDRSVSFGNVAVNVGGGTVQASGSYVNQAWQAVAQASGVQLAPFVKQNQLQNVSLAGANLNGRFIVSGTTTPFKVAKIRTEGAGVQIAGGTIAISDLQLQDQSFAAQLVANGVHLGQLFPNSPQALAGPMAGTFQIAGNRDFSLKTLSGTGEARLSVAGGSVTAANIKLADGVYQAQVRANNLAVQELAKVPRQFHGRLGGDFQIAGAVESLKPQAIQATGLARLNVAGGTITASNIKLANGRYQADFDAAGVELNQLNQQLRGQFGGKLQVAGTVESTKLADMRATGQVQLSQGISVIQQPMKAAIAWNGQRLLVERATSPDLIASGDISVNAQSSGIPEISELNLQVQAQNYNIQQLPFKLPNTVNLAGLADFNGKITGKLPLPNIQGQLRLRNLAVQDFAFESVLSGNIQSLAGRGVNLDVAGKSDRLAFNLDAKNRPNAILVKWQQALATGQTQGDNLSLKLENFPLKVLNLTPLPNTRLGNAPLAGLLNGDLQINQQTFATSGNIAIAKPRIGRITGDSLIAQFGYNQGKATITNSEFVIDQSRYGFVGNVNTSTKVPQVQGKLNINQGNIQNILTALQLFEIQDVRNGLATPTYGKAADLATNQQGLPNQPLLTQIERFSQVDDLFARQQEQRLQAHPLPELADLKGTFSGEVGVNTSTPKGLALQFNLNGQNWSWGKQDEQNQLNRFYSADRIIAEGSFENSILTLRPLRIESGQKLLAFKGNIGGQDQSATLEINNLPIELLNNFVKLPVGVTGNLNATAGLAGSQDNPQAKGVLQINDGAINQKKIESATASFDYNNGRLGFNSNVVVKGTEPVNLRGYIPFLSKIPENNEISLEVKVKDEGLTLLNLFTNQVAYEQGKGEVNLEIRGTMQNPIVNGIATLNNAIFSAIALPGKLTDVTGKATFDFDRISVENLQGKFSQGKVEATGQIPIADTQDTTIDNPLTVNLDKLTLNLKGLYQGGASGNLQITGSALQPRIGGKVQLFDGQVLLAESASTKKAATNSFSLTDKIAVSNSITTFKDLELELGNNVEITRPPILKFQAKGSLMVNGAVSDPTPDGTIRLESGGVNLFTTQFNLARGYQQTATFNKNQPRDPNLDIRLFAKVLDGIQTNDINKLNSTGGLAALETIRVEASINGPASKINENLQLTSSPSRSETEIVALLGGGFVDTQGRGDSTLGLINIAGSAVFNNFQGAFNLIGNAFGLSELRVFPTILSKRPEAGRSNSTVELALEAGVDISTKFSISTIKILTANDPFQWGINYRINDRVRLRASTNFFDDSRTVIEYERRF
jgi:translocation and assembly module TamB